MKLPEFLQETGIPVSKLASRCDLTYHQLYWALRGRNPTLKTAVAIQRYTDNKVMPEDLLCEESEEAAENATAAYDKKD